MRRILLVLLCLLLLCPGYAGAAGFRQYIVDTSKEKYTYAQMREDLRLLAALYPEWTRLDSIGESLWGQDIPLLIVGSPSAPKCILIQGSMHGREYMTTLLIMKQIEHILFNLKEKQEGSTVEDILSQCAIWFIPMANPDGVQLSMLGIDAVEDDVLRRQLLLMNKGSTNFRQWKANGRGVDINRNFPERWAPTDTLSPGPDFYAGSFAASEPETVALIRATIRSDALLTVSYHSRGSYMYWYYKQTGARYARDKSIAEALRAMTGYWFVDEEESASTGQGYRDWFIVAAHRPGFTLEIGSSKTNAPQPIEEFADIWKRNRDVPLYLAWHVAGAEDIR